MVASLLSVEGLNVRYPVAGPVTAKLLGMRSRFLDAIVDVSFSVEPGSTFGLVGESGSGKSTLGRAITRLTPAFSGSIRFQGREVLDLSATDLVGYRRDVAMMFQDPVASLSPRRTVRALLLEPAQVHKVDVGDPDAEVARLLSMVGLPRDFAGRYPHQLSGGQARRVGVARALALRPKLIVADEPTAGLDVSVQGEILNLLRRLQRELGLTLLIISHNLAVVRLICDRVAVMYLGRFVEQGSAAALFERPAHPYTHGLVTAQPLPDPSRRRQHIELTGEVPSAMRRPEGCEFHTRCNRVQDLCRSQAPQERSVQGEQVRCHFPLAHAHCPAGGA